MSSCGSSGYFSSSPTLSSSPPVLCNPKSGEWPSGDPNPDGLSWMVVQVDDCLEHGWGHERLGL